MVGLMVPMSFLMDEFFLGPQIKLSVSGRGGVAFLMWVHPNDILVVDSVEVLRYSLLAVSFHGPKKTVSYGMVILVLYCQL
jgi:hypothetical protein